LAVSGVKDPASDFKFVLGRFPVKISWTSWAAQDDRTSAGTVIRPASELGSFTGLPRP